MKWLATSVMLLLFVSTASAAPITFELLPGNGAIDGEAGATIGWGYTVTNQSEFWLELTNVDADPFEHAIADASLFDYAIIAPGDTHTVIYNAATLEGLYQLTWDASPDGCGRRNWRPRASAPQVIDVTRATCEILECGDPNRPHRRLVPLR